ncbi:unnamed protein product [Acanthoscelides obtectus]|uniref:DDE Tnp4 domain-containing protein n=1 Tax=Acanthoscelides obtectus TaxID=200917 RepID=A0A9P0KNW7_ACAOB|nr:unnamed protein product [Acanthoscelides obtectus]CAK1667597.1 Putative nuclease HARBI1 [Acanthoscelides obtectus]
MNVNSRFPGSTHDSFIWSQSRVGEFLRTLSEEYMGSFYLLGDSGYPLRPWLITPYLPEPPQDTPESRFNKKIKHIRVSIEQCFGLLKNRFRCLLKDRVLHYAPKTCAKIVNSCAVLHNLCLENNIPLYNDQEDVGDGNNFSDALAEERGNLPHNNFLERGRHIRNFLARTYF